MKRTCPTSTTKSDKNNYTTRPNICFIDQTARFNRLLTDKRTTVECISIRLTNRFFAMLRLERLPSSPDRPTIKLPTLALSLLANAPKVISITYSESPPPQQQCNGWMQVTQVDQPFVCNQSVRWTTTTETDKRYLVELVKCQARWLHQQICSLRWSFLYKKKYSIKLEVTPQFFNSVLRNNFEIFSWIFHL